MKIKCLILLFIFASISLTGQNKPVELSGKIKRLSKKIGQFNVVMIGRYAMYLDALYIEANNGLLFNNQPGLQNGNSQVPRVADQNRLQMDSKIYNVSYRRYRAVRSERELQVRRYRDLTRAATIGELLTLLDHEKVAVKCYAFWALAEQHHPQLFDILKEHYNERQKVELFNDLDITEKTIFEFMLLVMTEGKLDPFVAKLTEEQQEELNKMMLADNENTSDTKVDLLIDLPMSEENYKLTRKFATRNNNTKAILKLSDYKKDADLNLISKLFDLDDPYYGLKAARNFPNEEFFPELEEIHEEEVEKTSKIIELDLLMLYQALVQLDNPKVPELLNQSLNIRKKGIQRIHAKFIWLALNKFPQDALMDIYNNINLKPDERRKVLRYNSY